MSTLTTQAVTADSVTGLATHFIKSGWFKDTTDLHKAVVKIMAGQELGVGPMAAISGINIIQGKPVMSANLLASQVKASGKYNYKVLERTSTKCEIEFYEKFNSDKFEPVGKSSFTIEEAAKAKLTGKDNWLNYASDMLFARAVSRGVRTYCPDIFNGSPVYVPGELETETEQPDEASDLKQQQRINILIGEVAQLVGKDKEALKATLYQNWNITSSKELTNGKAVQAINQLLAIKAKKEAEKEQAQAVDEDSTELETPTEPEALLEDSKPITNV